MELTLIQSVYQERKDPFETKRKQDREDGRNKALVYAEEALLLTVAMMRDQNVDAKLRLQAQREVMNRAWGTPKATPDEDPRVANQTVLGILEGISTSLGLEEQRDRMNARIAPPQPAQTAHPLEAEFEEVDGDGE